MCHNFTSSGFHLSPAADCNESGAGGFMELRHAVRPFQTHGLVSLHRLGLCHHRLQDAVSAQRGQHCRILQQLHQGETGTQTHTRNTLKSL